MNEYLCHGYMAEEIFKEVGSTRLKRQDVLQSENSIPDILEEQNVTVHDKLLSDEGSSKYKNWLHRYVELIKRKKQVLYGPFGLLITGRLFTLGSQIMLKWAHNLTFKKLMKHNFTSSFFC